MEFLTFPNLLTFNFLGADIIMSQNVLACPRCHLFFPHYFDAYDHYRYSPAHEAEVQTALEHTSSGPWVNSKRRTIEKMFVVAQIPMCLTEQQVVWLHTKILDERVNLRPEKKFEELPFFDYVTLHFPIQESRGFILTTIVRVMRMAIDSRIQFRRQHLPTKKPHLHQSVHPRVRTIARKSNAVYLRFGTTMGQLYAFCLCVRAAVGQRPICLWAIPPQPPKHI